MKTLRWGLALSLLLSPTEILAQSVVFSTIRVPTCSASGLGGLGGAGGRSGASSSSIYAYTNTNSNGVVTTGSTTSYYPTSTAVNSAVTPVGSTSSSTAAASAAYPCPQSNGAAFSNSNGQNFYVSCSTYFDSDVLGAVSEDTFVGCLSACDSEQGCIAVSWALLAIDSNCVLLSAVSVVDENDPGFDSAYRTNYTLPNPIFSTLSTISSSTASSMPFVSPPPMSIPAAAGSSSVPGLSFSTAADASSAIAGGSPTTIVGSPPTTSTGGSSKASGHVSSSTENGTGGSSIPAGGATTATGGSSAAVAIILSAVSGGLSVASGLSGSSAAIGSSSTTTTSPPPTIPNTGGDAEPTVETNPSCVAPNYSSNNTKYSDSLGFTYDIRCGLQINGEKGDRDAHADSFPKCLEYCDLLEGCVAVTYKDSTSSTVPNCSPYWTFTGYNNSGPPGTYSGVNVNGASPSAVGPQDLCSADPTNYNQTVYGPDTFGTCYYIGCGQNVDGSSVNGGGTNLYSTDMTTLLGCLSYCSTYVGCVAVDWTGPHTVGNRALSNCYPKMAAGAVEGGQASATQYALATACV